METLFGTNPFLTLAGQKIEQATDASLPSENWDINMEICDIINGTEDGPKDAIKAIRKRLTVRNFTVVIYTLTVLETCVKNCNRRFHTLVCNKEFLQDLIKVIGPKNDPPLIVQEKVLSLVQSWADAFHNIPELAPVVNFYQDLKNKVDFPMTDLDNMAPILTPHKSIQEELAKPAVSCTLDLSPSTPAAKSSTSLTAIHLTKVTSDLLVVEGNMTVLGEMLSELTPGKEQPSDLQLLKELYSTCQAMQKRVMELIAELPNDQVNAELLRINDGLNNLFLRYDRFEKKRLGRKNSSSDSGQLIDLTEGTKSVGVVSPAAEALPSQLDALSLSSQLSSIPTVNAVNTKEDEFDMFAQSRKVTNNSSKLGGSSYEANQEPVISGSLAASANARGQPNLNFHSEQDFDEMAQWLGEKTKDSLSASEFEEFLAERAAAVETTTTNADSPTRPARPKKNDDESKFAL